MDLYFRNHSKAQNPFSLIKIPSRVTQVQFYRNGKTLQSYRIENRDRSVDDFFAFYKIVSTRMLRAGGVEGNYNHP